MWIRIKLFTIRKIWGYYLFVHLYIQTHRLQGYSKIGATVHEDSGIGRRIERRHCLFLCSSSMWKTNGDHVDDEWKGRERKSKVQGVSRRIISNNLEISLKTYFILPQMNNHSIKIINLLLSQIEKDDSVSILRIHGVQPRDVGEIRCTASVSGKGPSISCAAELRLNRAATHENRNEKSPNCNRSNSLRKTRKDVPPLVESPTRASRSSSLPRRSTPSPNLSPLPVRRNIPPSPLLLDRRTKLADKTGKRKDLNLKKFSRKATQRVYRESGDRASSDEEEEAREMLEGKRCETKLLENEGELVKGNVRKTDKNDTRQIQDNVNKHDNTPIICVKHVPEEMEEIEEECSIQNDAIVMEKEEKIVGGEEEFVAACIVKVPADVTVFRGNRVVLRVTYRGHPEPAVKWLRAVNIYRLYVQSRSCSRFLDIESLFNRVYKKKKKIQEVLVIGRIKDVIVLDKRVIIPIYIHWIGIL